MKCINSTYLTIISNTVPIDKKTKENKLSSQVEHPIKANGMKIEGKEKEFKSGRLEVSMKESGRITKLTGKESFSKPMGIFSMDYFLKIEQTEKGLLSLLMELITMEW